MRCAASPAGTAASSSPDAVGSVRSASTRTARCTCRPATWRRCSAIPPRRSRSSMRSQGRTRSRSACWDAISTAGMLPTDVTPDDLVRLALRQGAKLVGSSYNEPLITAEWALDVFRVAKGHGLKTAFISNGNATPEVLDYIRPWTDCYKIDFKAMEDRRYRELGGVLQHVLDAIRMVYERGFWLELVTLVVPGFNDDDAQLRRAADYIASVSPEIPWHVTAFHKDYRMTDPDNTSAETL